MAEEEKLTVNDVVELGRKHISRESKSIVPGFIAFNLDEDIQLLPWRKLLHKGVYFVRAAESVDDIDDTLYILQFDGEAIEEAMRKATNSGGFHFENYKDQNGNDMRTVVSDDGDHNKAVNIDGGATLRKVELEEGRTIRLAEAAVWAAIGDADTPEEKRRLFEVSYNVKAGKITEDTTGKSAAKQDTNAVHEQHEPNSKLANLIAELPLDGLNHGVDVSGDNEKKIGKQVITGVSLNYEDDDVKLTRHLSLFDREVSNAVTANYLAGNRVITARQIWQTMTGRTSMPSKTMVQKVDESIQRLMRTWAEVDYTQEARGRSLEIDGEAVSAYKISGHLLEGKRVQIETINGSTVYGYEFSGMPILYQHAAALGQVVTYPQRLLSTPDAGSDTEQNTVIKHYLIRRIGQMKHSQKVPRKILYETVYKNCGIENPGRKKQKTVNDYVIALLGIWKDIEWIKGFKECHETRRGTPKRTGVELKI